MRECGMLLPVASLPSKYGIGAFSKEAYGFIDTLKKAGQHYWQILPLGPTSYGDSPYQSFSAFAGNPYFINLDRLVEEGLLTEAECTAADFGDNPRKIDFGKLYLNRFPLLRRAYGRWKEKGHTAAEAKGRLWPETVEYCFYMAVKNRYEGRTWTLWDKDIRLQKQEAMEALRHELADETGFYAFLQMKFEEQWSALKSYANEKGIRIIGDIPIYVAADSADVWAAPELFLLDACGAPKEVAGCPPDAFSDAGQLWGNPLYDWAHHEKTGFAWWVRRIRYALNFYDILRIDHFRGFDTYYAIPYGAKTAQTGEWRSGPGMKLFRAVKQALGDVPIVAEDLGELFPSVYELLAESGFPGMKVLQFAFGPGDSEYLPHNHPVHCVVYTGTHDNTTAAAWYRTAAPAQRKKAAAYLGLNREEGFAAGLVRGALASPGELCIIPLADYLALGAEARINTPSTLGGANWVWRALPAQLCAANAKKIAALAVLYGRA